MNLEADLAKIALQERVLQFRKFDATVAWELGTRLKNAAEAKKISVAFEIYFGGRTLFAYAMAGTTPDNLDWIRRKRNAALQFHRSTYGLGLSLQRDKTSLEERQGLDPQDFCTHGGAFPIVLEGMGCAGVITVSGVPQREDHGLVVEVLAEFLGHQLAKLALE